MKTFAVLGIIFLFIIYLVLFGLLSEWVNGNGWAILFSTWLGIALFTTVSMISKHWKR